MEDPTIGVCRVKDHYELIDKIEALEKKIADLEERLDYHAGRIEDLECA